MTIKPAALKKGDLIGVMAPSRTVNQGDLDAGIKLLEQRGFQVEVHPQTYFKHKSSAGTEAQKADALHELFQRTDIKAIFAATGGSHALWLASDAVDYGIIRRNPKIFMGFSDTTALLNAFNARSGLTTFHGPLVKYIQTLRNIDITFDVLAGDKVAYPTEQMNVVKTGLATGPLIGGNMAMVEYLNGTKFFPKPDGAILFLEDTGEEIHNIDRMLWKLRASGVLDKISGLVFGSFSKTKDSGSPYGLTLEDVIERNIHGLNIPIVTGAPFGHDDLLAAMPVGGIAKLAVRRSSIVFGLDEPAVKI
ncbi:MAG: LD-carboxypeptidase family protein [Micavibrio sp.]|nr:LD-carboxypeptidase family protein [Micavibrio sp.]